MRGMYTCRKPQQTGALLTKPTPTTRHPCNEDLLSQVMASYCVTSQVSRYLSALPGCRPTGVSDDAAFIVGVAFVFVLVRVVGVRGRHRQGSGAIPSVHALETIMSPCCTARDGTVALQSVAIIHGGQQRQDEERENCFCAREGAWGWNMLRETAQRSLHAVLGFPRHVPGG